ncbi:MAG: hypothetical protein U0893_11085 [Chloroflexota bacterium]
MEPQPPPRSTPPPPPGGAPKPPAASVAPDAGATAASTSGGARICPECNVPRATDARYCEECGHDYGTEPIAPVQERGALSGPALWIVLVFWAAVAIAGLFFIYAAIWAA